MSQKNKHFTKEKQDRPVTPSPSTPRKSWAARLANTPFFLTCWLLLAVFAIAVYGDVFYMCEQYGFFAFDTTLMRNILDLSFGWYICVGRMLLLAFKYPLLGGILWAGMLTLAARLAAYGFHLPERIKILSLIPSLGIVVYLMQLDENIYYFGEPAFVLLLPLTWLLIAAVVAAVRRLYECFASKGQAPQTAGNANRNIQLALLLAVFVALCTSAFSFKQNVLLTARLQRLMQQQEWEKMADVALEARCPSRPVAAYYAVALSQTGQLNNRLFELHYQFPKLNVTNHGDPNMGGELYQHDCNFFAGLTQTAYHNALEFMVVNGPSIDKLKCLFLCSIVNAEPKLAEKYLHILRQVPFEGAFCDTYAPYVSDRSLLASDPSLSNVIELQPTEDSFEANYQVPLFLGYNVTRNTGKSLRALENSIAACLYAKLLPNAMERIGTSGTTMPRPVEEAVVLFAYQNQNLFKNAKINPLMTSRLKNFFNDAGKIQGDRKLKAEKLKDAYNDFYPYYYYYENRPDENTKNQKIETKGGVN